ncbi:MAG TPA: hypothetical protein VIN08_00450 [Ohtaekwangia sp.]
MLHRIAKALSSNKKLSHKELKKVRVLLFLEMLLGIVLIASMLLLLRIFL